MAQQIRNPNERFTDESHNPSQEAYDEEFNKIAGHLSDVNDQADAYARDNEKNGAQKAEDQWNKAKRGGSSEDRRAAERAEWDAAENHFDYRGAGDQQPTNPRRRFSQLLNKKNGIRAGIGGGVIGIALALMGFLTPFKIPSIMLTITDHAGQRLEQITTHRAKVIMARYIYSKAGIPGDQ